SRMSWRLRKVPGSFPIRSDYRFAVVRDRFRSAARLGFEPRAYQLVPLLMALRLPVIRLLIADDVGIGKTIEAGLILRELLDRGEADRFSVLCPPHLVEQWTGELKRKFDLDVVAVTASSAARLERDLPASQTLFDTYPY